MDNMNKLKVIEPIFGLEVGDVLVYNKDTNTYDFSQTDEQISANGTRKESRSISLSPSTVNIEFFSYFEDDELNKKDGRTYAEISDDYDYIKPVAIKVHTVLTDGVFQFNTVDYEMKTGDKIVKGIDGSLIPVSKNIFDKLFKVIK